MDLNLALKGFEMDLEALADTLLRMKATGPLKSLLVIIILTFSYSAFTQDTVTICDSLEDGGECREVKRGSTSRAYDSSILRMQRTIRDGQNNNVLRPRIDTEVPQNRALSIIKELPETFNCNPKRDAAGESPMSKEQCLVCSCYHEARSTPNVEKFATIRVMQSRALDRTTRLTEVTKDRTCNVIYAGLNTDENDIDDRDRDNQFTWTADKSLRDLEIGSKAQLADADKLQYEKCLKIVDSAVMYDQQYFARHYATREVIERALNLPDGSSKAEIDATQWIRNCYADSGAGVIKTGRQVSGWERILKRWPELDDGKSRDRLAHMIFPVCDEGERKRHFPGRARIRPNQVRTPRAVE